jgi:hypothetical protein
MPTTIKTTAEVRRAWNSNVWIFWRIEPSLPTLVTRTRERRMAGRPVAKARMEGMRMPSPARIANGISIPKKSTVLNGQKERAKRAPIRKRANDFEWKAYTGYVPEALNTPRTGQVSS